MIIPQGANSTFDNDHMTGERKDCISTTVTIDTYGKCEYKVIEKISEYDQSFRIREHIKKALTRDAFEKVKNFTFHICRCANLYFFKHVYVIISKDIGGYDDFIYWSRNIT